MDNQENSNQENRIWNLPELDLFQQTTPQELKELHSIKEKFIPKSIYITGNEKNEFINIEHKKMEKFHLLFDGENHNNSINTT
ncbi:MAG: hypothetical protein ACTHK0_01055 [Ginsengibacter sp.]